MENVPALSSSAGLVRGWVFDLHIPLLVQRKNKIKLMLRGNIQLSIGSINESNNPMGAAASA
jgi:hypothetical protein